MDGTNGDTTPHRHCDAVTLPDGTVVWASSLPEDAGRTPRPHHGLYFDLHRSPAWPHTHVTWPDFGLPSDPDALRLALTEVLNRARRGEVIDLGCIGGHGRTGTALAWLAAMAVDTSEPADPTAGGVSLGDGQDPVAWVRRHYCEDAIETPQQEAFARTGDPTNGQS